MRFTAKFPEAHNPPRLVTAMGELEWCIGLSTVAALEEANGTHIGRYEPTTIGFTHSTQVGL